MSEIAIGEHVLDYMATIVDIETNIAEIYSIIAPYCDEGTFIQDVYEGDAAVELYTFVNALGLQLQRMIILYQTAAEYIGKEYQEKYYNEEQIINWTIAQMGEGNTWTTSSNE